MDFENNQNMEDDSSYETNFERNELKRYRHANSKVKPTKEPTNKADKKLQQKLQSQERGYEPSFNLFAQKGMLDTAELFPTLNFGSELTFFSNEIPNQSQDSWITYSELNKPKKKFTIPFQGKSGYLPARQRNNGEMEFSEGSGNANCNNQMISE